MYKNKNQNFILYLYFRIEFFMTFDLKQVHDKVVSEI